MRLWGPNGPAEVMPALSHGWWKGWRGPKPLTADFCDQGRGFNALSVGDRELGWVPCLAIEQDFESPLRNPLLSRQEDGRWRL
jgi:hypothetical protein